MSRGLGMITDYVDHQTYRLVARACPSSFTVGRGAWHQIENLYVAAGADPLIFVRDIEEEGTPIQMADRICDTILVLPPHIQAQAYAYLLNERHTKTRENRRDYVDLELPALRRCHERGVKVISLNTAWGKSNPMTDDLRILHDEAELSGCHMYDVFDDLSGYWVDRGESVFHYRSFPPWFDLSKLWPNEVGVEIGVAPELSDTKGWHSYLSERVVINRMRENVAGWVADGVPGVVYFAGPMLNPMWDSYGATDVMWDAFAQMEMAGLKEVDMTGYDPHEIWDTWMKSLGSPGFNPETAIAKLRERRPDLGAPIGAEYQSGDYTIQLFTGGVGYWKPEMVDAMPAFRVSELPKS